jgi:dienelactone hydrolase
MLRCLAVIACALLIPASALAQAPNVIGVDMSCVAPVGDPAPGSPEWEQRDLDNMRCASLRNRDQLANPAFGFGVATQGAAQYAEHLADELGHPADPNGGVTTRVPGATAADPFRTIKRWTDAGRGRVSPVSFAAANGATLRGHVFAPPTSMPRPAGGFPGVVITDGSVQAYEELYFWAAEDLAASGYVVMTYDVQGQGDSSLLGSDCPGACTGVPYQQDYNFVQGAEDSLAFFTSPDNPFADLVDRGRVAIAGHSLGARAVSEVGQCDDRVATIVAWDNLEPVTGCDGATYDRSHLRTGGLIHVPALGVSGDYLFETDPQVTAPDADAKLAGYEQVRDAGADAMEVVMRNATHLAYTYIPHVFQSNQLGEREASYFTKAWLDYQLKRDESGLARLKAAKYDDSVDKTSIGAGTYDPRAAVASDPYSGNIPYTIAGIPIRDAVSFYYRSAYSLAGVVCEAMRRGC